MKRALLFLIAVSLAACAQAPKGGAVFTPPDGHWWLAASADQRDGFFIGWDDCSTFQLGHAFVYAARADIEQAITDYYLGHPSEPSLPVTNVIAQLQAQWRKAGTYKFTRANPANEYDGEWWRQAYLGRSAIVEGFIACRVAAGEPAPRESIAVITKRVNAFYGIPSDEPDDIDAAKSKYKLGAVILRAEREGP